QPDGETPSAAAAYAENNGSPRSLIRLRNATTDKVDAPSVETRSVPSYEVNTFVNSVSSNADVWPKAGRANEVRPKTTPAEFVSSKFAVTGVALGFAIATPV